ncbi:Arrestin domain-containing protein 3 [Liparis tanakae]|uniref:Arrestin domain-containing protein 3 n=1 Tax=Liparis tanakae TaxID=230148 RepID=A0A4Z2G4X5_9TELE|nr:Arrestin domain-containing protein 3 [Liparis tanakae]
MTVKHLSLDYDKVNEQGTFSPGDALSGRVTVLSSGGTKVQCFLVKAKGRAKVTWHTREGQATRTHRDKRTYFYLEHIIIQDKNKGDDMPSSYEGKWGSITYSLQAQLTQSIWLVHKTKTEFPFLTKSEFPFASKSEMIIIGLKVVMNVTSESLGVKQGEAMAVSVEVLNDSARSVTPTFHLCEKQTFAAQSERTVHTSETLFGTGDPVAAETGRSITRVLSIPPQLHPTFFNCCMMRLEYRLKRNHMGCMTGSQMEEGLQGASVTACPHMYDVSMLKSVLLQSCSVLFPCVLQLLSGDQSHAADLPGDTRVRHRAVRLDVPRHSEIKIPLVVLLGSPKPRPQQPKRSIWFKNLPR